MSRALIDSNVLIDFLAGNPAARAELDRYAEPGISVVSWIEVIAGIAPERDRIARGFLAKFERFELTAKIAEQAAAIRRTGRMKLPDAIILATAQENHLLLVTRNTRDFPEDTPGVRNPYRI